MATLAIVPMETKMVYRIGAARGVELDRKSIFEFMSTVGLGLASQASKLRAAVDQAKGLGKSFGGAVGGMVMSFGTTYALGQLV